MKHASNNPLGPIAAESRSAAIFRRAGSAFTLVEMLVAIGAVALVSVGLAAIFQTVGKTVTTGKRVSQLTQQAAILESQMREDFAKLTRDGFLVIRHQFTIDLGTPVVSSAPRFKGDPVPMRPRRIDEIMFFATGDYRSTREQMIPGKSAEARAARIYYGHGQRGVPMAANSTDVYYDYFNPSFDNRLFFGFRASGNMPNARISQNRLGGMMPDGNYRTPGVNYFASDWTLLRHATLLQKPGTAPGGGWPENAPKPVIAGNDQYANTQVKLDRISADNPYQIAGQPAAPSIFRSITEMLQMNYRGDDSNRNFALFWPSNKVALPDASSVPRFESGLVEIATTDLDEIALIVNGMGSDQPNTTGPTIFSARDQAATGGAAYIPPMLKVLGPLSSFSPYTLKPNAGSTPTNTDTTLRRYFEPQTETTGIAAQQPLMLMQSWMLDAMPTSSGYYPTVSQGFETAGSPGPTSTAYQIGARIRYDDETPDLRGTLDFYTGRDAAIRRTDLLSLGLSRVAAHCTEFVVEWSWGQTYPATTKDETGRDVGHQIVWYGRTLQPFDASGAPLLSTVDGRPSPDVYHYDDPAYTNSFFPGKFVNAVPPSPQYKPFADDLTQSSKVRQYVVNPALVHGGRMRKANDKSSLISYFGYYDPMFVPADMSVDPPSMPWPWPKMLRITVTLADANDPSIEQSFQYVFDLPPDQKP